MPNLQYVINIDRNTAHQSPHDNGYQYLPPTTAVAITLLEQRMPRPPQLKIGTGWIQIVVMGEVDVVAGFRGYAPILPVKVERTGLEHILYISATSLTAQLEPLRLANGGHFKNLRFSIRKESEDRMSAYELTTD